jgi:Tfp pilus assembly protein PilZ
MEVPISERRIFRRLQFKTALRVRVWKAGPAERREESLDISEKGAFFVTDAPIPIGSAVEILLKMPAEVTGKPATEWRCSGRVVRLQPADTPQGKTGVGVEFDYYEILRSKAAAQLETADR